MARLTILGTPVPPDFPASGLDAVVQRIAEGPPHSNSQWAVVGPAWNAVAYRFLAAARADDALGRSFLKDGTAPVPVARTRQELALFAFVTAACACVESLYFALYASGSILRPAGFPLNTLDDFVDATPGETARRYRAAFPGDPLAGRLRGTLRTGAFRELTMWRNIAVHRAALPRMIYVSAGKPAAPSPSDAWRVGVYPGGKDVALGPSLTRDKRDWLATRVTVLVAEVDAFLTRQAVP